MNNQLNQISTELLQIISREMAWQYRIIPLSNNGSLELLIDEKMDAILVKDELEILIGRSIMLIPTSGKDIDFNLAKFYRKGNRQGSEKTQTLDASSDTFIESLIKEAKSMDCSDIHMEPYEEKSRVRMRLDGKLVERFVIDNERYPSYLNKIKIMSNLDIAEKRLPQDGRIFFKNGKEQIDIRVSILPTLHGEKAVLRLLGSDASNIDINSLGFDEKQLSAYQNGYNQSNGIILISGPTGSGKTTTLYATLKELNQKTRNILTIEDPIEYTMEGINQVQLREKIGLDFAASLRTFLRQDPDIIMVGEIRDVDTAKMATRAALTGHLVLSTIHTNSASGVISRLVEMGVSPFLIADTLNITVAQRLVRVLCPECKKPTELTTDNPYYNTLTGLDIDHYYESVGCSFCHNTGYRGRKAIYEVIPVNNEVSKLIKNDQVDVIDELMKEKGIELLVDSALKMLKRGETSLEEINPYINHD